MGRVCLCSCPHPLSTTRHVTCMWGVGFWGLQGPGFRLQARHPPPTHTHTPTSTHSLSQLSSCKLPPFFHQQPPAARSLNHKPKPQTNFTHSPPQPPKTTSSLCRQVSHTPVPPTPYPPTLAGLPKVSPPPPIPPTCRPPKSQPPEQPAAAPPPPAPAPPLLHQPQQPQHLHRRRWLREALKAAIRTHGHTPHTGLCRAGGGGSCRSAVWVQVGAVWVWE